MSRLLIDSPGGGREEKKAKKTQTSKTHVNNNRHTNVKCITGARRKQKQNKKQPKKKQQQKTKQTKNHNTRSLIWNKREQLSIYMYFNLLCCTFCAWKVSWLTVGVGGGEGVGVKGRGGGGVWTKGLGGGGLVHKNAKYRLVCTSNFAGSKDTHFHRRNNVQVLASEGSLYAKAETTPMTPISWNCGTFCGNCKVAEHRGTPLHKR